MRPLALYSALFVSYFGDYCSLIGLFELAKRFGGSHHVIALYILYSLPPLLFFIFSSVWARHQKRPGHQLAAFSFAGVAVLSSLFFASTFAHILVAAFALGIIKQAGRVLVNTFIKRNFAADRASKIVSNTVTIRYFIMVFGGALGAYLGGIGQFNTIFAIDALSFLVAGIAFLFCKEASPPDDSNVSATNERRLPAFGRMVILFGAIPLLWCIGASMHTGLFMAVEYPLLTSELGVATSLIGIVWTGHIIGTLLAQVASQRILERMPLRNIVVVGSLFQILGFGSIGMLGSSIAGVTLQMTAAVFWLVFTEILSSSHLMKVSTTENYPMHNILFRTLDMAMQFIAQFLPITLLAGFSLAEANALFAGSMIAFLALSSVTIVLTRPPSGGMR